MAIRFASHPHGALKKYQENVPKGIFRICPKCGSKFYFHRAGKYQLCPNCGYGFRVTARARLKMLTKDFTEWDADLATTDPLDFPDYQATIKKMQSKTKLKDAVLTGQA
ncbi:MAG: acetyl-CoA carboxylase carboxyl transferase subunit beta, partial [Lactobacillus helsingborgensis]|nr:acetyl-CoA carboxylase carboxyl transferase subunit beta [Lactobacillus helsingborgensis]